MNVRQLLAETARRFLNLRTRNGRRRQELRRQSRRQVQLHLSDQPGGFVHIDRRLGVERSRAGQDQLRRDAILAGLAPFDTAFALVSPTQRRALVIKPEGPPGRNDLFQEISGSSRRSAGIPITSDLTGEPNENIDIRIAIIFRRAIDREIGYAGTSEVAPEKVVFKYLCREQRYGKMRHLQACLIRMKGIEQPLGHVGGVVVAAQGFADILNPGRDVVRQDRCRLRAGIDGNSHISRWGQRRTDRTDRLAQGFEQCRRHMFAIEGNRAGALAVDVDQPIATELQHNVDHVSVGPRSLYAGADVAKIVAGSQTRNASLSLVDDGLFQSRPVEEIKDVFLLQYIREHVTQSTIAEICRIPGNPLWQRLAVALPGDGSGPG